jgi:hypothetical protein
MVSRMAEYGNQLNATDVAPTISKIGIQNRYN